MKRVYCIKINYGAFHIKTKLLAIALIIYLEFFFCNLKEVNRMNDLHVFQKLKVSPVSEIEN
jgi:hypothetical protein